MEITRLTVQHLRTHTRDQRDITARVTVIIGKNGSGKTTLLEALHIALRGTSFRGSDGEVLQHEQPWWRIDMATRDDTRTVACDFTTGKPKKKIIVNDRQFARMPAAQKYPVVLFEPDDLRLLHGSPSRRRAFIDTFIGHINPLYAATVRKYERALKQRNALLKQPNVSRDDMFAWDMALAEYGAEMILQRIEVIERINLSLTDTYQSIAGTKDTVRLSYSHTLIDGVQQKLVNALHASFVRDTALGFTSIGPHRHDVMCEFNGQPSARVASRGEVRSIILALKFIEVDVTQETTGVSPVILLDDVFAELDETRQRRLAEKCRFNQMFITSTNAYTGIATDSVIHLD